MVPILTAISCLLIVLGTLPFVQNQHWVFRATEFIKPQLLLFQVIVFGIVCFYTGDHGWLWYIQMAQLALIVYHVYILMHYTKFWSTKGQGVNRRASDKVKVISCNVYQFNTAYDLFLELIKRERPDVFLTMESNSGWERAMRPLEKDYPYHEKVTLENTYGMHFYSKLKVNRVCTHFFVADDLPSIEAELETRDGHRFVFFGVHPPPPSPTEEANSKERDGDLLSVAKKIRGHHLPVLVAGDFNNVAWAKASILFRRTSGLIDARIGRGMLASFHAKYWFFRVPLDLLFHSPDIFVDDLVIHPYIGSDHFPVGCLFHINERSGEQEELVEQLVGNEMGEDDELIREGKQEESENREDQ